MPQTSVKHTPITFYLRMLLYMFIALLLRMLAFAPLACLLIFPADSPLRYLALLCPALLMLLVLPLRFSFAEAIEQWSRERRFSFDTAFALSHYAEKLVEGLLHALNVLKWGIPLLAMLGYAYYYYISVDFVTLFNGIQSLGKGLTDIWCGVANFFITLFGSVRTLTSMGGIMEGIYIVIAVLGVGVLILMYGAMRNSATRYIWVMATHEDRSVRNEVRRRLRGRRLRQFLVCMVNLVLWLPVLCVIAYTLKGVISEVAAQFMQLLGQRKLSINLIQAVMPLILTFLFLYMPLLPIRRWMTASFAMAEIRGAAPLKEQAKSDAPEINAKGNDLGNRMGVAHSPMLDSNQEEASDAFSGTAGVYMRESNSDYVSYEIGDEEFDSAREPIADEMESADSGMGMAGAENGKEPAAFTIGQ